ncbi:MAG: hypothetical protein J1E57_10665 [Prevotella sp.]|nr:hypothetical protein [Prevotella sp.]
MEKTNQEKIEKNKDSWSLFLDTLTKIGCQYEFSKDGNEVGFTYEDNFDNNEKKEFIANFDYNEEEDYDRIWIGYLHDIYVNKNNEKEFSAFRDAINLASSLCDVSTYYILNKTTGEVGAVSKTVLHYISHIPNFELFLKVVFQDCFIAQKIVEDEMEKFWKESEL